MRENIFNQGNTNKKEIEHIFNKQCSFDQYLWKNMVEQLMILFTEKCQFQKREFETLNNKYNELVELFKCEKLENAKLKNIIAMQEKSRVEIIDEELLKYKEKVCLFILFRKYNNK